MARLTVAEREAIKRLARKPLEQPPLALDQQWVLPTPQARLAYIHFATAAAKLYRGPLRPVGFKGEDWRL